MSRANIFQIIVSLHGGIPPLELTNAQKLSLDPTTTVGTLVDVIDAIHVNGSGESAADGWYLWTPELDGVDGLYNVFRNPISGWEIRWAAFASDPHGGGALTTQWGIKRPDDTFAYWGDAADDGGGDPTAVGWNTSGPVDRPPFAEPPVPTVATETYLQKLIAPSILHGGVFSSGADSTDANGVFSKRGTSNGKNYYNVLGILDNPIISAISWHALGGILGTGWGIWDSGGALIYYSTNNVATPDQVTTWISVNLDQIPTVVEVLIGELTAGAIWVKPQGLGLPLASFLIAAEPTSARQQYIDVAGDLDKKINWTPIDQAWEDSGDIASGDTATAWAADWSGTGINVSRNDVANESNWVAGP